MKHYRNTSKDRELISITYKNDMIFEIKSAALKPGACIEVGRVAGMVSLFPDMAVHVEVGLDTNSLGKNGLLSHRRVQAVKNALLKEGIAAHRIRTTVDRVAQSPGSDNTVRVKVVDRAIKAFKPAPNSAQHESQFGCQPF